ncbi:Hpt domain-containing protein [Fundidesulfovibrio soli]|uniref:Hpt domain-containing protein n=1 Tax=Fundidesulfovibrio soli TaxID=2922716 RepID=UPI001FAF81DB|nr:Hpt domain-containing protein [Fundidesulfovibrio soli]
MDLPDDDITGRFIQEAREHLAAIEARLPSAGQPGTAAGEEFFGPMIRAVHSIKAGAGIAGLRHVRDLARMLEILLRMILGRQLAPGEAVPAMLGGAGQLRTLLGQGGDGEGADGEAGDVSATLDALSALAISRFPKESQARLEAWVEIPLPGGSCFSLPLLGIEQALQGGKFLYLVEYDLTRDVQARGKSPLDVIAAMESSGIILDCREVREPQQDPDSPPPGRIPFFLLYATVVEPDVVSYLFALDSSRITQIGPESLAAPTPDAPAAFAAFPVEPAASAEELAALRGEVLAALNAKVPLILELGQGGALATAVVQFLCAAHRGALARGLDFALRGADAPAHQARLKLLGFPAAPAPFCPAGACPLCGDGCPA